MSKRWTLDKFIEKAVAKHGNKYDYSNVIYNGSKQRIIISCPTHGNFNQRPDLHLSGRGCPKCGYSNVGQFRKHSLKSFITKAHKVHNNKYDYSLVKYVNGTTKITIMCLEHGPFEQSPSSHLEGRGCQKCGRFTMATCNLKNTFKFIIEAAAIHDNIYDYSKVNYMRSNKKVSIICVNHGEFKQSLTAHLMGQGCPHCNRVGYSKTKWVEFCNQRLDSTPMVYIIRCFNDSEEFVKIGITSTTVQKRFVAKKNMPYFYEIIKEIKGSADFVFDKEKELHRQFKDFRYSTNIHFFGHTECFNISILSMLK